MRLPHPDTVPSSVRAAVLTALALVVGACAAPTLPGDPGTNTMPVESAKEPTETGPAPSGPGCDAAALNAPVTLLASAPLGISASHLGRPVDARFESFAGESGRTLFPEGEIRKQGLHRMEHSLVAMESRRATDANIGASAKSWGFSASGDKGSESRFASYRASQLVEFSEVDDATQIRKDMPKGAVWYIARIYYGRSYELVLHANKKRFTASVKARLFFAKGGVKKFAEENGLSVASQGRGLEPVDGEAIFAQGEEEISKAYRQSGDPVPVFVEYRSIPRACVPTDETIEWVAPWRARVAFDRIDIYRHADGIWNLGARCSVNDREIALENPLMWSGRSGISSQCTRGALGPQGNPDFCSYNLYWAEDIELVEGDRLRCGVTGSIGTSTTPIVPSEFSEVVTRTTPQAATSFGDGDARVEYRVHYGITAGD